MIINKDELSGFNCPTIGKVVSNDYEFVQTDDGRWELKKIGEINESSQI